MTPLRHLALALLIAACPGVAAAQFAINCGQTVTGTIVNASTVRTYQFAANAGEAVVVAGVLTSFDGTYFLMELRAPNGALLAESGGDVIIPNTVLTTTGLHSIVVRPVTPFDGPSTFNLNLQFSTGRCAQPIACGQTLSPVLAAPAEQDAFSFDGNAGEAVVVATKEHVFPEPFPALQLYSPGGALLAETNFFTPSTESVVLPVTGRYTIVTFDDSFRDSTGQYTVDLQFTTGRCAMPIACGQTPAGSFEVPAAQDALSFTANAGEAVVLAAVPTTMGGAFDVWIDLYDPAGTKLDLFFRPEPLVLPVTGTYTVVLHDVSWEEVGSYRVNLQFATGRCATPIACGQTVSSTVAVPAEQDAYSFPSAPDDWFALRAEATSPPLVAYAKIFDPSGTFVTSNYRFEPGVVFTTPDGGTHTVLVSDFDRTGTGSYQLRRDCLEASISTPVVTEGGGASADFTVTLAAPSAEMLRMGYFTFDGTALAHLDYTETGGQLTFAPGATTGTVTVPVIGDALDEPNERFHLTLGWTPSTYGSAGTSTATILDDDGQAIPLLELDHGARIDGSLATKPGPVADQDLFVLDQRPASSYEVVVDATSGDVGGAQGLLLERIEPDLTTVIQPSQPVGTGPSRSLRWQNLWEISQTGQMVRVRSASCTTDCGPDDVYRLRFYDTTYSIPRFNNGGSQVTVLLVQNPGDSPVTVGAHFWNASGHLLHRHDAIIPPRALLTLITPNVPELAGRSGSITVTNDAPYGVLAGKAVAVEPSTGLAFDSPMAPRPVR